MRRPSFSKCLESKRFMIVLSLVIAVAAWFVTVVWFDPEATVVIDNVPITINMDNTQAQQLGLAITKIEPETVSLTLSGKRYKIGTLSADDFTVTASAANVTSADTYELTLIATQNVWDNDYQIAQVSPNQCTVTFDAISSKNITLSASAPNISVGSDYILETPVAQPETLEVEGPEQSIQQLSSIVLVNDTSTTLANSKTLDATPVFYAEDGTEMDPSLFSYNPDIKFKITIPVYKQKTVPLTFKYKNAPSALDTTKLQYTISPSEITVAGATDAVDNLTEINLGYIDFRSLDLGKSFDFSIPIPSGFKQMDNVDHATVNFDSSNWDSKLFSVNDIRTVNQPAGYSVSVDTTVISNVKVVGMASDVAELTGHDMVATIDFTNQTLREGKQTIPVAIDIVSKDGVWAVGNYTCVVTVSKI